MGELHFSHAFMEGHSNCYHIYIKIMDKVAADILGETLR